MPSKRIKTRNHQAVAAHFRKAGPMKDRRAPRGGADNAYDPALWRCAGCGAPKDDDDICVECGE